jgi:hypothetical protein
MSGRPTQQQFALVSIVVVGGPDMLIEAVRRCAGDVSRSCRVVRAQLASAATHVASERPFAIVISNELYAFDAAEFDALARDVKAEVLALPTAGVPIEVLCERLLPLLRSALQEYFRK